MVTIDGRETESQLSISCSSGALSDLASWAPRCAVLRNGPSRCAPSDAAPPTWSRGWYGASRSRRVAAGELITVGQKAVTPWRGRILATASTALSGRGAGVGASPAALLIWRSVRRG